jgi:hypothetical protein
VSPARIVYTQTYFVAERKLATALVAKEGTTVRKYRASCPSALHAHPRSVRYA